MLVLTRKIGQQIRIADNIVVTITGVQGNRVKVGIDAPPEYGIRRGELPRATEDHHPSGHPLVAGEFEICLETTPAST